MVDQGILFLTPQRPYMNLYSVRLLAVQFLVGRGFLESGKQLVKRQIILYHSACGLSAIQKTTLSDSGSVSKFSGQWYKLTGKNLWFYSIRFRLILCFIFMSSFVCGFQEGAFFEFKIIASRDFPVEILHFKELKSLFMMQTTQIRGQKITIVEYRFDHPLREKFSQIWLNMNKEQLQKYWVHKLLKDGQIEPVAKKNSKLIFYYLKNHPMAISYCRSEENLPEWVKEIKVISSHGVVSEFVQE